MSRSRVLLRFAIAIALVAATLLIALVLQPSALRANQPDGVAPLHVDDAQPSGPPARPAVLDVGEPPAMETTIEDDRAEIDPSPAGRRTALDTAPSNPGVRVHGVVGADPGPVQPKDCSIALHGSGGRLLATRVRNGASWSFESVPAGQWTLVAEAVSFRPRRLELTLRSDERVRYLEIHLESASFLPVHLALQPRAEVAQRLQHRTELLSSRTLRLVSTHTAPDRVVTADLARAGGEAGLPVFRRRNGSASGSDPDLMALVDHGNDLGADEYVELPTDCIGIVPFESQSSFHLSLCLGSAVLRTLEVHPSIGRADFTLSLWDLEAACTTVTLRVVEAERGLPLPAIPVSLADASGTMTVASTAPDGRARFEGVLPGWYALALRTEGRADLEERILVVPGQLNDLGDRRLEQLTTIRGFVVDGAGSPVQVSLLARPLGAVDEQRFVRAVRGQSSASDGTFALPGLGRGPHVVLLAEGGLAARPVRVDTSVGDVLDVRIDAIRSTPVRIQLAQDLRAGTLVRLDTPEGLPVFAAVLQATREHLVRIAPGRYRLTATFEGRVIVEREVEVGSEGSTLVVKPEKR